MDLKARIEPIVSQVVNDRLGDSIKPEKLASVVRGISERLSMALTVDHLADKDIQAGSASAKELAVLSVIGQDSVGIVAEVSRVLFEANANIEGMNMAIVSGYFALILSIDIAAMRVPLDDLQKAMDAVAEKKNLRISIQHENIFKKMNRI